MHIAARVRHSMMPNRMIFLAPVTQGRGHCTGVLLNVDLGRLFEPRFLSLNDSLALRLGSVRVRFLLRLSPEVVPRSLECAAEHGQIKATARNNQRISPSTSSH